MRTVKKASVLQKSDPFVLEAELEDGRLVCFIYNTNGKISVLTGEGDNPSEQRLFTGPKLRDGQKPPEDIVRQYLERADIILPEGILTPIPQAEQEPVMTKMQPRRPKTLQEVLDILTEDLQIQETSRFKIYCDTFINAGITQYKGIPVHPSGFYEDNGLHVLTHDNEPGIHLEGRIYFAQPEVTIKTR